MLLLLMMMTMMMIMMMTVLVLVSQAPAKISEVSTTIHGMFYIGYMPSFWIRLRALGDVHPSTFARVLARYWPAWVPSRIIPHPHTWTQGAVIIW
jgi:hypothetical protein